MSTPLVFRTTRRVAFSELDPFDHLSTGRYAAYFVDHRMHGVQDHFGWDARVMSQLGFLVFTRRIEIDFRRPAQGGQEVTMTSWVREFRGADAVVDATMSAADGTTLATCVLTFTYLDAATRRPTDWAPEHAALFMAPELEGAV